MTVRHPPFVPLVRESSVVIQDNPLLPDDIELMHEKHKRVLQTWWENEYEDTSQASPDSIRTGESFLQRRRRRILVITSVSCMCLGIVGIILGVSVAVGKSKSNPSSSQIGGANNIASVAPSANHPEEPSQAPMSDMLSSSSYETRSPTVAPVSLNSTGVANPMESLAPTLFNATKRESLQPAFQIGAPSLRPSLSMDSSPGVSVTSSRICNGVSLNCNRRVNEVMFATLHNAMSSEEDGFYGPNHALRLEKALEAGYRGLMIESCDCGVSGLQLCNSLCFSGTRDPVRVFNSTVDFLMQNPNEVIIMVIKVDDESLYRMFDLVFTVVDALRSLMYSHDGGKWPVLNDLIDRNERLIVFQHGGPDCNEDYVCPSKVHNTFSYMFETPTDLIGTEDLIDSEKSCTVAKGSNQSDFFIFNHFANGASGQADAETAGFENKEANIQRRLMTCRAMLGRDPSLLVVDYWSIGDALRVVQQSNELASTGDVRG